MRYGLPAGWSAGGLVVLAACAGRWSGDATPPPAVLAADSTIRSAIANERSIDASSLPAGAVAVAPFQINSSDTTLAVLAFGLADLLITDLSRSGQIQVVDRLRIDAFLREMGLVEAGYVDSAGAARFGRIIGARRVVMGSLTTSGGNQARIDGRVGDVASGTVEATAAAATTLDLLLDAEKAFAFAVFDRLGVALSPAERTLVEQRPTRSLAALLAYSRGLRAELVRDYPRARAEYQSALRIDGNFSGAESKLEQVEVVVGQAEVAAKGGVPGDLARVSTLALAGINAPTAPRVQGAADPAFRERLLTTIIILLNLP